ncbi:MAG: hypothetical protein ACK50G_03690 [bacterium]
MGTHNVTHQGSPAGVVWAPLAAWTHHSTGLEPATPAGNTVAHSTAPGLALVEPCWVCRRCGARQGAALRLGFLRHGLPGRRRHDHSP